MATAQIYPAMYRKNIRRITDALRTDCETAFSMMLMTAVLTDLYPDDPKVAEYILKDCGIHATGPEETV